MTANLEDGDRLDAASEASAAAAPGPISVPVVAPALTPKHLLLGLTLASGWLLKERLDPPDGTSGGNFGVGYKATRGGELAFVKAIDFVEALTARDPLKRLSELANVASFEKDVLEYCTKVGMTKVLRYIGHEYITYDGSTNPMSNVSCLVMEAGSKDLRHLVNANGLSSCGWNLQVMTDVLLACSQLHKGEVAHQDIKPQNVIAVGTLATDGSLSSMKVGDLGRVVRKDQPGPFNHLPWPGDRRYGPPESWYGYETPDWTDAREAQDAYMIGSLLFYLFTGTTLQSQVFNLIPGNFLPGKWTGGFDQDLKAVLIDAQ